MIDFRPVANLIGLLVAALGASMAIPALVGSYYGDGEVDTFLIAGLFSTVVGGGMALGSLGSIRGKMNIQQIFLMTTLVWLILPVFAALPFWIGAPGANYTDAFFEAMSALTTTGSTVFSGLDDMPRATLIWRAMLQWFGGVGIVVVAMGLLPALKVGGMQIFRTEAFDTMGKVLPRAAELSLSISTIYVALTIACVLCYSLVGMNLFDAVAHALTTISTGGFSTYDASFGAFQGVPEYVASVFMILASLPFVRFVQLAGGAPGPLWKDVQIRAFLKLIGFCVVVITIYRLVVNGDQMEHAIREALFNVTSIMSGTGYSSVDYQLWGPFPVAIFFLVGLIGGCAGSTSCSIKIFRYQILVAAVRSQIRRIHSPHGVFNVRYDGRPIERDVMSSVMAFLVMFMTSLIVLSIGLGLTGLDLVTSISGAASALANIGPGLGDTIGPAGNFAPLPDAAKWLLAMAMLLGRLELMSVFVLFTVAFWRH